MLQVVLRSIARHRMLAPGDRVIAAVSGGPDSVCLFHVLREIAPRLGIAIAGIAHVNHKLRGQASDEDQRFVQAIARQHGVPFYTEEARVADAGGNLEQAARRARLALFAKLIRKGVADRIATGHTRDDQAETVLFRILRGTGPAGLAGIVPVTREGVIRPLLDVTRAQVEVFLRNRGIAWREDLTNAEPRFARNRIRHQLMPQIARDWNPRISGALAHLAEVAGEEERWWDRKIRRLASALLIETGGGTEMQASKLAALPRAVSRRLVRHGVGALDFDHVEAILDLAVRPAGEGRLELPGLVVARSFDWLRWQPRGKCLDLKPVRVEIPGSYRWADGASRVFFEIGNGKSPGIECATLKLCGRRTPVLELRGWRAGDHYHPAGDSRDRPIAELFQNAKIPSWRRDSWPIVTNGTKILWTREFGPAAEFAAESPGKKDRAFREKSGRGKTGREKILRIWETNDTGV